MRTSVAKRRTARKHYENVVKHSKPGTGKRSAALVSSVMAQGKSKKYAEAVAGKAGREKYGDAQMDSWAHSGDTHVSENKDHVRHENKMHALVREI